MVPGEADVLMSGVNLKAVSGLGLKKPGSMSSIVSSWPVMTCSELKLSALSESQNGYRNGTDGELTRVEY